MCSTRICYRKPPIPDVVLVLYILIGFVLAASINVDSLHIVQVLANNPDLAKAVAAQAENYPPSGMARWE